MQLFSLTQAVQGTTYSSIGGKESLLDIALISTPEKLKECSIIPPISNSDHNGLILKWSRKLLPYYAKPTSRTVWKYSHADFEKANELLAGTD